MAHDAFAMKITGDKLITDLTTKCMYIHLVKIIVQMFVGWVSSKIESSDIQGPRSYFTYCLFPRRLGNLITYPTISHKYGNKVVLYSSRPRTLDRTLSGVYTCMGS